MVTSSTRKSEIEKKADLAKLNINEIYKLEIQVSIKA